MDIFFPLIIEVYERIMGFIPRPGLVYPTPDKITLDFAFASP